MQKVLVTAIVGLLVLAGTASASRRPTTAEAKAVRSAVTGFIKMPGSPAAKDNKITAITISTVDPRYASATLNSKTAGPSVMVLHQSMGTWWELEFGSSLGCDTAPKSVMTDLKVGCSPPDGVAWISNCGSLQSEPKSVVLTCADANYELSGLTWRKWGKATASAKGSAKANNCTPYCAAGHFGTYPVAVVADKLTACGAAKVYTRLTLVYPGKRPAGIAKRDVRTLSC